MSLRRGDTQPVTLSDFSEDGSIANFEVVETERYARLLVSERDAEKPVVTPLTLPKRLESQNIETLPLWAGLEQETREEVMQYLSRERKLPSTFRWNLCAVQHVGHLSVWRRVLLSTMSIDYSSNPSADYIILFAAVFENPASHNKAYPEKTETSQDGVPSTKKAKGL